MPGANHTIPIDGLTKGHKHTHITECIPWGDTVTFPFHIQANFVYIQTPPYPPAFWPPIPMGQFDPDDVVGPRTAKDVTATVTIVYTDTGTGVSNTITLQVKQSCP
jgi:hypothetical protein